LEATTVLHVNSSNWSGDRETESIEHDVAVPGLTAAPSDFSLGAIAAGTLGRLPKEFLEAILVHGETDANQLTNRVFWKVHHPELTATKLHPTSAAHARLRDEWRRVRRTEVQPVIWLRQLIDQLDRHRGGVSRETLLGWIAVKSDGNNRLIGRGGERGYFQIDRATASRDLGMSDTQLKTLSTDRLFSIRKGVELVVAQKIAGNADRAREIGAQLKARADMVPVPTGQPELEEENGTRGTKAKVANTFDVPWRWICKVAIRKNGRYHHGGTGVLISDRHVLTAAHVVAEVAQDRAQFDLEVTPALSGNASLDTVASSSKPLIPSRYKSGELAFDYALIRLDKPLGTRRFKALKNTPLCYWGSAACGAATVMNPVETRALVAKAAHSAGYPKNKGAATMWQVTGLLHSADSTRQVIWYTGDASEGQSGSPVWIREGNLYCLAGVLVAEGRSSSAVVPLTRDMVAQLRAWMATEKNKEYEEEDEGGVYEEAEQELNTRSRVDKSTPQWIQTALGKSRRLSPFLTQKLATVSIARNFVQHGFDDQFNMAYMKFRKTIVPFDSPDYKARGVSGFFDRATSAIHLRPAADLGQAVRLAMRKLSQPGFREFFGKTVDAGVELYFANVFLQEQGMKPVPVDNEAALTCATQLVGAVGEAAVGKAYFQNHADLVKRLRTALTPGALADKEIANDGLCRKGLLPAIRLASHQLTNMVAVGITGPRWVRLWMRSAAPGAHEVHIVGGSGGPRRLTLTIHNGEADGTAAVTYPQNNQQPPLDPLTRYQYRVVRTADRAVVGEGGFETAPANDAATPQKVVIALWSCHQPFATDGSVVADSARMLRLMPKILRDNDVKFILPCGDQIYADDPEGLKITDNQYLVRQSVPLQTKIEECNERQIRSIYNTRYRTFWSSLPLRDMYANYPNYPTLDDHEIRGDWGSKREHALAPAALKLKAGALRAYFDYQAKSVLPPKANLNSFHYDFSYGNIGVFVMDIRSQRAVDTRTPLFGDVQLNDFRQFLHNNAAKKVLLIVASVPVVHLGRLLTDVGVSIINPVTRLDIDFPDHWSYSKNIPARDAFLTLLHAHQQAHPKQRIAILSGDVHIGNAFGVQWENGRRLYQFTASPLSAVFRGIAADITTLGPRLLRGIDARDAKSRATVRGRVQLLKGIGGRTRNPLVGLNVGLIEIQRDGDESKIKFKLVGHHPNEDRPLTHFESDWLA
jgi:alkaline phosphatase D